MSQVKRQKNFDNPHGSEAMAFEIHSPIRLDQLDAEIVAAMGWRKGAVLSVDGSASDASANAPAVLFVGHAKPDQALVMAAITAYVPDPEWTPKGEPVSKATVNEVRAHARAGATLSPDEIQVALRHLLT